MWTGIEPAYIASALATEIQIMPSTVNVKPVVPEGRKIVREEGRWTSQVKSFRL